MALSSLHGTTWNQSVPINNSAQESFIVRGSPQVFDAPEISPNYGKKNKNSSPAIKFSAMEESEILMAVNELQSINVNLYLFFN